MGPRERLAGKLGSADRNPSRPRAFSYCSSACLAARQEGQLPLAGVVESAREFCAFKLHAPSFQPQDPESQPRQPLHPRASSKPGP